MTPDFSTRPRLGEGALQYERRLCVFVNCPFDASFQEQLDAIVFVSICCGFVPRCSTESGSTAKPRMERIVDSICGSKYSIHDLSRCRGEGELNLARFNMPLELGMAMTLHQRSVGPDDAHDWLVLVPKDHLYKRFISDLAGYDPIEYDGSMESFVAGMMSWLATRRDAIQTPTPRAVLEALPQYMQGVKDLREQWEGLPPWPDILMLALHCAQEANLIPKGAEA